MIRSGGDDDGIEGTVFRPAVVAVSLLAVNSVLQAFQTLAGALGQFGDDLDGIDLDAGDLGQNGRLVA